MGLDITAYRNIKRIGDYNPDYDWENGEFTLYPNNDFPGREDGIARGTYTATDSMDFRAGSYGGYNAWREQLAQLVGHKTARDVWGCPQPGPFVELINFSDCEGTIGPETSKKLAQDFSDFQHIADAHDDEWFIDRYNLWRKAFEMAADNGAVEFY